MLFSGSTEHTIDGKLRLAIPAKYRNQWDPVRDGDAWFCIPWPSGHLRLFTEGLFKAAGQTEEGKPSLAPGEDEAGLESTLYGFAERLEMDANGRIAIPKTHLQMTGVGNEVVIVGARTRLEVHDRAKWNASIQERFLKLPDLVAKIHEKDRKN